MKGEKGFDVHILFIFLNPVYMCIFYVLVQFLVWYEHSTSFKILQACPKSCKTIKPQRLFWWSRSNA
jgi:hypothetical protein